MFKGVPYVLHILVMLCVAFLGNLLTDYYFEQKFKNMFGGHDIDGGNIITIDEDIFENLKERAEKRREKNEKNHLDNNTEDKDDFIIDNESFLRPVFNSGDLNIGTLKIKDNVNHPEHYNKFSQEAIDTITDWIKGYDDPVVGYNIGNSLKYLARAPYKHVEPLQDLKKAQWYLSNVIKYLEENNGEEENNGVKL